MKNNLIKFLCLLLVFILCACEAGTAVGKVDSSTVTSESENPGSQSEPQSTEIARSLEEMPIIYDAENLYSVQAAHKIAEYIKLYRSVNPVLRPDTVPAGKGEIVVGKTSRKGLLDTEGTYTEYSFFAENGNVYILGASPMETLICCEEFGFELRQDPELIEKLLDGRREAINGKSPFITNVAGKVKKTDGSNLRIMSFNILSESYNDKLPLEGRDTGVAKTVMTYLPDVVGLEEVTVPWHTSLASSLEGIYAFINDEIKGQNPSMSTIMYRTDTVELLECKVTPYTASSNQSLRNFTWARFRRLSDGTEFIVTCTHWDINSNAANRVKQIEQNVKWLGELYAKYKLPTYCCGDYNRNETTEEYLGFLKNTGFCDSLLEARKLGCVGYNGGSTHSVGTLPSDTGNSIDHIALSKESTVIYFTTLTNRENIDVSDHCPIYVDVNIPTVKGSSDKAISPSDYKLKNSGSSIYAITPSGRGTKSDPYLIENAGNLKYIEEAVNSGITFGGKYIKVVSDISLENAEWKPIGDLGLPFCGNFDGDGHSISGLKITEDRTYVGLFAYVTTEKNKTCASLKNFTLSGEITLPKYSALRHLGAVAAYCGKSENDIVDEVILENIKSCVFIDVKGTAETRISGIAAMAMYCKLTNVSFGGEIKVVSDSGARVGGICAQTQGSVFEKCVNSGKIEVNATTGSCYASGIASITTYYTRRNSTFTACINDGTLKAVCVKNSAQAAGILATTYTSGSSVGVSITNCLNTGAVSAVTQAGGKLGYAAGIIGYCNKADCLVESCVNTASDIIGNSPDGTRSGGIFSVFNLADNTDGIICRNCITAGTLYGFNKNKLENNIPNASAEKLAEAESAIRNLK